MSVRWDCIIEKFSLRKDYFIFLRNEIEKYTSQARADTEIDSCDASQWSRPTVYETYGRYSDLPDLGLSPVYPI